MKKLLTVLVLMLMSFTLFACSNFEADINDDQINTNFNYGVSKLSVLGSEKIERQKVKTEDGGLEQYPTPTNHISDDELKALVLQENIELLDFDALDADGNYYKDGVKLNNKLFRHSVADTMYVGEVPDTAQAYSKTITIKPHKDGNTMTGLYVPAGEVVIIELEDEDIERHFNAEIGRMSSLGNPVDIPDHKNYERMPNIVKKIKLDKKVNYIGHPFGGPVYINTHGHTSNVKMTITGAIEYPHFILGTTSKTEFERLLDEAQGIVFDLEVPGIIRLTMPSREIQGLTAEEIIEGALFWEMSGSLSNYINQGEKYRTHVITQIYDSHIPAGAAVAFVGASFTVNPFRWARDSVNMKSMLHEGSWGNMHEFNHHHQAGIGAENGGEVNNNVVSMLSYLQFTNLSTKRSFEKENLFSWNKYVDPSKGLGEVIEKTEINTELDMHVPMMHSFGVKKYADVFRIPTVIRDNKISQNSQFFRNLVDNLGFDMTYYMKDMNNFDLTQEDIAYAKAKKFPMYIPVATTYQVGQKQRIYNPVTNKYKTEIIKTAQPYVIDVNKEVNINESLIVPKGFDVKINKVKGAKYGKVTKVDGNHIYTPTEEKNYDQLELTLTLSNGSIKSKQTLVLGFGIQSESAKQELTAKVYTNPNNAVTLDNIFDYERLEQIESLTSNRAGASFSGSRSDVMVIEGQIVMPETKDYTFYIAADDKGALYVGDTRDDLKQLARVDSYLGNYDKTVDGSFGTVSLKANEPMYFKLFIINDGGGMAGSVGYDNGSKIVDVPHNQVYSFEGSLDYTDYFNPLGSFEYRHEELVNVVTDIEQLNSSITVSSNLRSDGIETLIDGNVFDKGYHSQVDASLFPGSITIQFDSEKTFNSVELHALRNEGGPRGLPKDIKILISNDGFDFKEVYDGVTKHEVYNIINLNKSYKAKFLKLEIHSSHREDYIGLSEIAIKNTFFDGKIVNALNGNSYNGSKFDKIYEGAFVNGFALETTEHTLKYKFAGNNIAVYSAYGSKYGKMQVRVNGGKWTDVDLNSDETSYGNLAFIQDNLKKKENIIEIRSKNKDLINIDYFVVDAFVSGKSGINWLVVSLIMAGILVAVGGVLSYVFVFSKKKSISNDKNTKLDNKTKVEKATPAKPKSTTTTKKTTAKTNSTTTKKATPKTTSTTTKKPAPKATTTKKTTSTATTKKATPKTASTTTKKSTSTTTTKKTTPKTTSAKKTTTKK